MTTGPTSGQRAPRSQPARIATVRRTRSPPLRSKIDAPPSFTGLSVEPPRFVFCVRKAAACHDTLLRRPRLSVALLGATDHDEALRFASSARATERFETSRWRLAASAPPSYRGGLARATCDVDQIIDVQTHSIFIVTAADVAFSPGPALVTWIGRCPDWRLGSAQPVPAFGLADGFIRWPQSRYL